MTKRLDYLQMNMVRWCSNECHNQRSGEKSVARMVEAYNRVLLFESVKRNVDESMILTLAYLVDPRNEKGYRQTPVSFDFGNIVGGSEPQHIQRQMELMLENMDSMTVDEFVKRFLDIHPFEDGNGRVAALLYNYLNGDLYAAQPLPDYFGTVNSV